MQTPPEEEDELVWREAWDDLIGEVLDAKEVATARADEVRYYRDMEAFELVPVEQAWKRTGRAPIGVRWIDVGKGDREKPNQVQTCSQGLSHIKRTGSLRRYPTLGVPEDGDFACCVGHQTEGYHVERHQQSLLAQPLQVRGVRGQVRGGHGRREWQHVLLAPHQVHVRDEASSAGLAGVRATHFM